MKFIFFADTHRCEKEIVLPEGDVLVFAGDMCYKDPGPLVDVTEFLSFYCNLDYQYKIMIAGNHDWPFDNECRQQVFEIISKTDIIYLEDSACEIDGITIWGSPVQPTTRGWPFYKDDGVSLLESWSRIPDNTDVVVTHIPPFGILDKNAKGEHYTHKGEPNSSKTLLRRVLEVKPRLHVFGHCHLHYGEVRRNGVRFLNVCSMSANRKPENPPIVVELTSRAH